MGNKITLHIHHDFISAPPKQAASGRPPLSGCDVVSFPGGILRVFLGEITKKPCWLITYNLKHYGFLGYISYIELVHEVYKPRNQETRFLMFSELIALIHLGSQLGESSPGRTSNNLREFVSWNDEIPN